MQPLWHRRACCNAQSNAAPIPIRHLCTHAHAGVPSCNRPAAFIHMDINKAEQGIVPVVAATPVATPVAVAKSFEVSQAGRGGVWKADLCGCCEDCCTCWASWCCGPITTAQLASKTSLTNLTCKTLASLLCVIIIVGIIVHTVGQVMPGYIIRTNWGYVEIRGNTTLLYLGSGIGSIASFMMCILVCKARAVVRIQSGIPGETNCGGASCEDCCCACCCTCCTMSQLFRHLGIGTKSKGHGTEYSLCSETGEKNATLLTVMSQ